MDETKRLREALRKRVQKRLQRFTDNKNYWDYFDYSYEFTSDVIKAWKRVGQELHYTEMASILAPIREYAKCVILNSPETRISEVRDSLQKAIRTFGQNADTFITNFILVLENE